MASEFVGAIAGLYEVGIGVRDLIPQIQYWQQFGYRIGQVGTLPAETAQALYGVPSALRSIRLYHQDADHGLIRLMAWEQPVNEGLQMASMKGRGNRWATSLTRDLLNLWNHAEEAARAHWPIRYTDPSWEVIYPIADEPQPFNDVLMGVREMLLLQPLTRQVLFERFNYTMPHYGQIHEAAFFQASQITHMGLIIQDDHQQQIDFYEDVIGLLRSRDGSETTYEQSQAARQIFDLQPGERFWVTTFDDPRSSTDFQAARSGRLYIIRFPESMTIPNYLDRSRPGCLGFSLYTCRVQDLTQYRDRIQASAAQNVTDPIANEFGELSFSFIAPDGYFWTLLAA